MEFIGSKVGSGLVTRRTRFTGLYCGDLVGSWNCWKCYDPTDLTKSGEHWVSLSVSEFLSIGRVYADETLPRLVSFMLTSYLTQVSRQTEGLFLTLRPNLGLKIK